MASATEAAMQSSTVDRQRAMTVFAVIKGVFAQPQRLT
jgi:hypothetical protein